MNEPRLNLVQMAGMLPRDPDFRTFVGSFMETSCEVSVEEAAEFIRVACGIDSRRQLREHAGAAERFNTIIRKPYLAWKEHNIETARG